MILQEIAEKTKIRIADEKAKVSLEELKKQAYDMNKETCFPFFKALSKRDLSFICEVKKASPSKGIIAQDFPYMEIAADYERSGADAISVLTEPFWFKGSNQYVKEISSNVSIPILRKDFTVDEYMIYEAKTIGASAILLICAILNDNQLKEYTEIAHELGLSVLVEAHDETEVNRALKCDAKIIGVNNRDLRDFTVDITNSIRLRKMVPQDYIFVSESGIKTKEDIANLKNNGTNAVLIGETLMRCSDKKAALDNLKGA